MRTTGPAATIREALLTGAARQSVVSALNHLVGRSDLELVRQRLWVRHGAPPDPYRLAARIAAPCAFAYGSALALHGAGPSERGELLVFSPHRFTTFESSGMHYRWARPWIDDGLASVTVGPAFVRVTSAERTLVDCARVPANAGGVEELSRAVDTLPALDGEEVVRWVDYSAEAVLPARLGFLLERSGLYDLEAPPLRALLRRRPSHRVYLAERRPGGRLVARWNLIVPPHLLPGSA